MFCKNCGKSNLDHSGYCVNDGVVLNKNSDDLSLKADINKFCPDCGNLSEKYDIYCSSCGKSYYSIDRSKKKDFDLGINLDSFKNTNVNISENIELPKLGSFNWKKSISYAAIGFIVLLILSFMTSTFMNETIDENLGQLSSVADDIGLDEIVSLFDIALLSNGSSLNINLSTRGFGSDGSISLGHIYLIAIPIIIFIVIGIVLAINDKKEDQPINILSIVSIALIYGFLILILASLYRTSMKVPQWFLDEEIRIKKSYSILNSFIKGSLISIGSLGIGYSIYSFISGRRESEGEFKEVLDGFGLMGIIYLLSVIIAYFTLSGSSYFLSEEKFTIFNLASYALALVNFGKLEIGVVGYSDKLSLYKDMEYNDSILSSPSFGVGLKIGTIVLLLIPIAIFLYYGLKNRETRGKKVFIVPISYSIMVLIIYSMLGMSISGGLDQVLDSLEYGVNNFGVFINTLVLSLAPTLAGYLLSRGNENG